MRGPVRDRRDRGLGARTRLRLRSPRPRRLPRPPALASQAPPGPAPAHRAHAQPSHYRSHAGTRSQAAAVVLAAGLSRPPRTGAKTKANAIQTTRSQTGTVVPGQASELGKSGQMNTPISLYGWEPEKGACSRVMNADETMPFLRVGKLTMELGGQRALDAVDMDILPGEVHGLVGENGSGKSTLIKILAGFHVPLAGTLEVAGRRTPLPLLPGQFRELGFAFVHQDLGLIPSLRVLENLMVDRLGPPKQRAIIRWRRGQKHTA